MNEDCLRSIVYNFRDHVATLIYEPDCEYDLEAIAEYCDEIWNVHPVTVRVDR